MQKWLRRATTGQMAEGLGSLIIFRVLENMCLSVEKSRRSHRHENGRKWDEKAAFTAFLKVH